MMICKTGCLNLLICYHLTPPGVQIRQIQNLSLYQREIESHEHFSFLQAATRIRGQAELLGSSIDNVVLLLCSHNKL